MNHELEKLDKFLGLPIGTSYDVLIRHNDPRLLNDKLRFRGIVLDHDGILPKAQRGKWRQLMTEAGVHKRYWKDPELLTEETTIDSL